MTEHRGPDAKKVYSFRFSPNDLIHWRLAAESRGLTLNAWIERNNNISLYDFALGLIDAGTYPGRRSKLMGLQAQLLIDARRKEDGDAEPPSTDGALQAYKRDIRSQERLRGDRDVAVDRRSTRKPTAGSGDEAAEVVEARASGLPESEVLGQADIATADRIETVTMIPGDRVVYVEEMDNPVGQIVSREPSKSPEPELAKQILAKRGCCVHGTQRGWRCWQCGGKAKIAGDPETMSKREQAKAEREKAKASKKKGKR